MRASDVFIAFRQYVSLWFHKRNIIIVSQHQVKHLHISGKTQLAGLGVLVALVFWLSYSTGSFMAARQAIKDQAIAASVTRTHISLNDDLIEPNELSQSSSDVDNNVMATKMDKPQLLERVAVLEQQVNDLKASKADIIERVREKTSGRIDELETIIEQTGLRPKDLIKNYAEKPLPSIKSVSVESSKPMGGPYIPATSLALSAEEQDLFSRLDRLAKLRNIISELPLASPLKDGSLQSGFGRRIDPFTRRLAFHAGLDISGPSGAQVLATADGKVKKAGWSSSYGNYIDIDHGNNISTRYAHLSQLRATNGQIIKKGDIIGIQGSTGRSTGQHLHYEVRYRDQSLNPRKFLDVGQYVLEE